MTSTQQPGPDQYYSRVGGWLLILCVVLVLVTPVFAALALAGTWQRTAAIGDNAPGLYRISVIESALLIGTTLFGIVAGLLLWLRQRRAILVAQLYLISVVVAALLSLGLYLVVDLPPAARDVLIRQELTKALRTAVFAVVWFLYLKRSYRVQRTFAA